MASLTLRPADPSEWDEVMTLAFSVFLDFEADSYGPKGTEAFKDFLSDEMLRKLFIAGHYKVMVAELDGVIVGMASVRNGNHLSLLFVDKEYHRLGVGRHLLEYIKNYLMEYTEHPDMTVNSSPYAVDFYHKIGFVDTGDVAEEDGIIYTPMRWTF